MDTQKKYELIESYLQGSMTAEERENFERQMQNDASLQEEVFLHKALEDDLPGESELEFQKKLEDVDKSWKRPESGKSGGKVVSFQVWAVAAILIVLIGAVFFTDIFKSSTSDPQQLFASNFEPYQMILNTRSGQNLEGNKQEQLNEALEAYAQKKYTKAASIFEDLTSDNADQELYELYAAVSRLAAGQAVTAAEKLEKLQSYSSPSLRQQIRWYLALAHLKSGQLEQAKKQLKKIGKDDFRYTEARDILDELE
jgi:tetratricopeptide (TPR) repeat protein